MELFIELQLDGSAIMITEAGSRLCHFPSLHQAHESFLKWFPAGQGELRVYHISHTEQIAATKQHLSQKKPLHLVGHQ